MLGLLMIGCLSVRQQTGGCVLGCLIRDGVRQNLEMVGRSQMDPRMLLVCQVVLTPVFAGTPIRSAIARWQLRTKCDG
jgi:hypothetical protein